MKKPTIAIIGRPNTGKSTLFNKITGENKAITNKIAGTTRDILSKKITWQNKTFQILDTGGLDIKAKTKLEKDVQAQAKAALKKADVILFILNTQEGLLSQDLIIAKNLKTKPKKNVIVVANKADNKNLRDQTYDFYKLGLGKPYPVSAVTGSGTGDLLDKISTFIKDDKEIEIQDKKETIRVGIFGKPNVGKSSILNSLIGKTKVLVSEMPGTTLDAVDTLISYRNKKIIIVDTAGIRRKAKVKEGIERYSIIRSLSIIKNSDIGLLVLDAMEEISRQDFRIATEIVKNKKSIILVINKLDLLKSSYSTKHLKSKLNKFVTDIKSYFPSFYWAPVIIVSAKTKENISNILNSILNISKERNKVIPEDDLNSLLSETTQTFYPKKAKNKLNKKLPKIKNIIQINTSPPKFNLYVGKKDIIPNSYLKFLEKKIREHFLFTGTPIIINLIH